jgi:hypothetical protein
VPDDFPHIAEKTLTCFDYAVENVDFDVVFRTNCSSYVDLVNLRAWVDAHAANERFYAGVVDEHYDITFASGSGYFLSNDLVKLALADREAWDERLLDDVALGRVLNRHGVLPVPAPRQSYDHRGAVGAVDVSQFHFRCKTRSSFRLDDVEILVRVHRAFEAARGLPPARVTPWGWTLVRAARAAADAVRRLRRSPR